jgi:Uma2 family endonuclease
MPVEVYLRTTYPDTDREYRDGDVLERTLPDYLHGKTQMLLLLFFGALRQSLSIFPCSEVRMKLREGLYLIPDVAVFHGVEPSEIPDVPPLIVIEILSPDDRLTQVRYKLDEFRRWGVAHVWLVDPLGRHLYSYESGLQEVDSLQVPELAVELGSKDVFE